MHNLFPESLDMLLPVVTAFLMAEVRPFEQIKTVLYNYLFLTALNKIKKMRESLMISAVHAMHSEEFMSLLLFTLQFSLLISSLLPQSCLLPRLQPRDVDYLSKSLQGKAKY